MKIRPGTERGRADHGWLRSFHTFSFADYFDPQNMGFRSLRVINDDRVAPGRGFGAHAHKDMEIISYVLDGALQHRDSMGNGSVMRPGEVQRMSAGTGVRHSELNESSTDEVHFLQIWILPDRKNHAPGYEQTFFPAEEKRGRLRLIVSPDGADGSLTIHQDARVYAALMDGEEAVDHMIAPGRAVWVHVARGEVRVNGERLVDGDAAMIDSGMVRLSGGVGAEVLVFDLV